MRIQSAQPMHNGGWFHKLDAGAQKSISIKEPPHKPTINATKLMFEYAGDTQEEKVCWFASSLGVSCDSLRRLDCAWAAPHRAWAFAMKDGWGNTVGIRLRYESGKKLAVTGSRQGIFIPNMEPAASVLICEGPTDLAAALTLGYFAIARPSCMGGNDFVNTAIRRFDCRQAIIVSDNDGPGIEGAKKLSQELRVQNCIVNPPAKDLREFISFGGTKELLDSMLKSLVWRQPKI